MVRTAKPYAAHTALHLNGYSTMPVRSGSQAAFVRDWTRLAEDPLCEAVRQRYERSPLAYNIAVVLGHRGLVVIDRDTDDERVVKALRPVFAAIHASRGGAIVGMFGSKGCARCFRWGDDKPCRNISFTSPDLGVMLEVSGAGRAKVIPPSSHPKTGKAYIWRTERTLLNTHVDQLMSLYAADVVAMAEALAPFTPPPKPAMPIAAMISASELTDRERFRQGQYARAIIAREVRDLAAMPTNSGRNRAAFDLVCRVAKFAHHGVIEARELRDAVLQACEANGLVQDGRAAVLKTIESGMRKAANDVLPDLRSTATGGR